jgi:MipA family protein
MSRSTLIALAAMFMMVPLISAALEADKSESSSANPDVPGLPLWEAGVFGAGVTQPAYPGADERASLLFGLPFVIYRGEYLRIDRSTVGVRAIKTPRSELDVGFAASLGTRAEGIEARRGMDDLGMLLEFGPRLKINIGDASAGSGTSRIQIPVRGVFDLNDHFRFRGISYELQWVKDLELPDNWSVTTNLAAVYGDQQLVDTFYRVAPAEATPVRPAYAATAGLIALRASLWASHLFTPDMRLIGYLRFDSVAGAANHDSPLVRRDSGWTLGLGLAWTLADSERGAKD